MARKEALHRSSPQSLRKHSRLSVLVLAAVAVVLALAGIAVARYVMQQQQEGLATASNFSFTSDYLKEESESASYYIDPTTTDLNITLSNAADAKRFTAESIDYTASATNATIIGGGSGTLAGGLESTTKLTVSPNADSSPGNTFTVTASSTSPYAKTLTATFILAKGNSYQVEDAGGNTAAVLTITCTDSGGPVTVELSAGVVPDTTDSRVTLTSGGFTFQPSSPGVYSIVLLKSDKTVSLMRGSASFANTIDLSSAS